MRLNCDVVLKRGAFQMALALKIETPFLGIYGPSGSGKSSLLELLCGLAEPSAGKILLDGEVLFDRAHNQKMPAHLRRIGMLHQDARLFPHLNVRQNLVFGRPKAPRMRFDELLNALELEPLLSHRCHQLSGGQAQRVALARAILAEPRLLLLDEPLSSLDLALKRRILPFLRDLPLRFGISLVLVSHDWEELQTLAQCFALIEAGCLRGVGSLTQLLDKPELLGHLLDQGLTNPLEFRVLQRDQWGGTALLEAHSASAEGEASTDERAAVKRPSWQGPMVAPSVGEWVRGMLRPSDIVILRGALDHTSIRNQFKGRVTRLFEGPGRMLVEVDIGLLLWAEITPRSARELELAPGELVSLAFKAHALRYQA